MFSSSDFERLFIRYKAESVPSGESIQDFCFRHKVPYNLFDKWYKDTRHRLVEVQVSGKPESTLVPPPVVAVPVSAASDKQPTDLRILLDLRMNTGLHIHQRNLSYSELKLLVEKLEVLC